MMGLVSQFVQLALGQIVGNEKELAQKIGADERIVKQVTNGIGSWITEPERLLKLETDFLKQAREHDVQTYNKDDLWVNRLRSSVRPVVTFVTLFWYVYARVTGLSLQEEDYVIIGGVFAFWFGFRPFEKRK